MPSSELIRKALDEAFVHHFAHIFGVLMSDPSDAGLSRFERGLHNMIEMYDEIEGMIQAGAEVGWAR